MNSNDTVNGAADSTFDFDISDADLTAMQAPIENTPKDIGISTIEEQPNITSQRLNEPGNNDDGQGDAQGVSSNRGLDKKSKIMIAGVVVSVLLVMVALVLLLSDSKQQTNYSGDEQLGFNIEQNQSNISADVTELEDLLLEDPVISDNTALIIDNPETLIITQSANDHGTDSMTSSLGSDALAGKAITDEERLYDGLLETVNEIDVPPEAIQIDQSVINRKMESQKLASLESKLISANASVSDVKDAVNSIQVQVSSFAEYVDKNAKDQSEIVKSIEGLTNALKSQSAAQEKELRELREQVLKAQKSADQAMARTNANTQNTARVQPKPIASPVHSSERKLDTVAVTPKPHVPSPSRVSGSDLRTPAKAQEPVATKPQHCDGSRVSSNWRVKGVNNGSAYIVRAQDQVGMYLKVGVSVSGFGQVQSFDVNTRSVCTTSGLIRR